MRSSQRIDRFLFSEYQADASSLGIYRVLYATCMLVVYLPQHLWIPDFPGSFFNPPFGLTMFFAGFPPAAFFVALNAAAILAAACLLIGYRTRLASCAFALLLIVGNAWAYSFGKINNDILVVALPLVLQFAGWGDAYSFDARRGSPVHPAYRAWPLALLALLIGFGMMTAAYGKAVSGWLDPKTHAVLGHFVNNALNAKRDTWFSGAFLQIRSDTFWELNDWGTVALEGSFLIAALNRRAFRVVCAVACFFHLGIALTMRIPFWPNVLAYGAFCEWSALAAGAFAAPLGAWSRMLSRVSAPRVLLPAGVLAGWWLVLGNPFQLLAARLGPEPEATIAYPVIGIGALIASYFLLGQIRALFGRRVADGTPPPVILFDGVCGLCNHWVDFVIKFDRERVFRFAALQSDAGAQALHAIHMPADFRHSIVLVDGPRVYYQSSAILRILRSLGLPFSLAYVSVLVPRPLRDWTYKFVADHRLRWFGERDACRLPTPDERERFL